MNTQQSGYFERGCMNTRIQANQIRTEQNRTEQNRTERNGTERNGTERNGMERNGTEQQRQQRCMTTDGSMQKLIHSQLK